MHQGMTAAGQRPRFFSVEQASALLGVSAMTLYRLIRTQRFPAVKIATRYVIPAKAIDEIEAAACTEQACVDPAEWTVTRQTA